MVIEIEGKIVAKERPRFGRARVYTPSKTKNYEEIIKKEYLKSGGELIKGYVSIFITSYFKVPKSYYKSKVKMGRLRQYKLFPDKKPDIDNIAKIVLDGLNKIAYEDDKQVIELTVIKRYTEETEKNVIEIKEIYDI